MTTQLAFDTLIRAFASAVAAELIPLIRQQPSARTAPEVAAYTRESVPAYLTVKQVAAMLGVAPKTVRGWIGNGKLPAITVGREYRVEAAALRAFKGTNESSSDASGKSVDDLVCAALARVRTGS